MSKITYALREAIQKGLEEKKTYREMADELGLSKSAVGYEIKHHTPPKGHYTACRAQWESEQKAHKKNRGRWKVLNEELVQIIDKEIRERRSPKDISLCLKRRYPERKDLHISHETIYQMVYGYRKTRGHPCLTISEEFH